MPSNCKIPQAAISSSSMTVSELSVQFCLYSVLTVQVRAQTTGQVE